MSFLDFHLSIITPTNKILGKGQQIVEAAIHIFHTAQCCCLGRPVCAHVDVYDPRLPRRLSFAAFLAA